MLIWLKHLHDSGIRGLVFSVVTETWSDLQPHKTTYNHLQPSQKIQQPPQKHLLNHSQTIEYILNKPYKCLKQASWQYVKYLKRRIEQNLHLSLESYSPWSPCMNNELLRGCPCKNRPLDFRPKTEFLQIFRVRQLVHVINKNGNNLAFNAIFQYFWRQFQRTVQNRLNRSVSSQI